MQLRALLVASILLPAGIASAAIGDPCTPDVVDQTTGTVTTENFADRCEGTTLVICSAPAAGGATVETALACATIGGISGGSCEVVFGNATCTSPDGEGCLFSTADGTALLPCTTDSSGCVDGTCTPNVGACTPPAADVPLACTGDDIDFGCTFAGQQLILSCGGLGALNDATTPSATATCTGAGDTLKCIGAAAGDSCGTGFMECAASLSCEGESAQALGTCGTAAGEGEGEGEGDGEDGGSSRDDEVEPAPSGCPFNAAGSFPAFGALALLVAGLRRRRA